MVSKIFFCIDLKSHLNWFHVLFLLVFWWGGRIFCCCYCCFILVFLSYFLLVFWSSGFFPLFVLREREKACVFVWERQQRQRKRKSWSWERGWEDLWGVERGETMWTNYIVLKILVWKGIVFIVNSTSETRVLWVNRWTMTITLHNVWKLTKNFAGQNINL